VCVPGVTIGVERPGRVSAGAGMDGWRKFRKRMAQLYPRPMTIR
jgi:hypothetical protein